MAEPAKPVMGRPNAPIGVVTLSPGVEKLAPLAAPLATPMALGASAQSVLASLRPRWARWLDVHGMSMVDAIAGWEHSQPAPRLRLLRVGLARPEQVVKLLLARCAA